MRLQLLFFSQNLRVKTGIFRRREKYKEFILETAVLRPNACIETWKK